jgi:hypothetical protein
VRAYSETENKYIVDNYLVQTDMQLAAVLRRSKASIAIHRNEVLGLAKSPRTKKKK